MLRPASLQIVKLTRERSLLYGPTGHLFNGDQEENQPALFRKHLTVCYLFPEISGILCSWSSSMLNSRGITRTQAKEEIPDDLQADRQTCLFQDNVRGPE